MDLSSLISGLAIGLIVGFGVGVLFTLKNERKVKVAASAASTVADAVRKIRD